MRWLRDALFVVLLFAALALAAWLSVRWQAETDLSFGARASLAPASRDALAQLEGPLEVVSYARGTGDLREAIAAFVDRYRRVKRDIALRFVDPDADPAAMRERGITVEGELELRHGERHERLTELDEATFTRALLRLARTREAVVAFVAGHGERKPDGQANHDLGEFARALREQGVTAVSLNLADSATMPRNVTLLVLASPQVALTEGEVARLRDWVAEGGALLWLTEPGVEVGLTPLAQALGVAVLPGTVVDATGQGLGIGDPSFVALTSYPQHAITQGFALTTMLPQAAALAATTGVAFAAKPIAQSSKRSWSESGAIADNIAYDADSAEMPGPLDLGLALTRLSPRPDRDEQRVVVLGDGDFLSNSFLANGGNRALGLRVVNWLLQEDALVDIAPMQAPDRAFALDERARAWIGVGLLIALPLALLAAGAVIAWRRRRR
jgi:hypothetical protein